MPTSITVKNIPDAVYRRLQQAAASQHRSINSEIIARLESSLLPRRVSVAERLERARQLRQAVRGPRLTRQQVASAIRQGRP